MRQGATRMAVSLPHSQLSYSQTGLLIFAVTDMTSHGVMGSTGVFFNYEISPMKVVHTETRQSFAHFLTS